MHLNDDQLIGESVDMDGKPVPSGVRSAKIYVTNLINIDPLPLIRYEITDEVTLLEGKCPCGRLDDSFTYAGVGAIHPHVFRSRLGRERHIVEYQVTQTRRGATVALCCTRSCRSGKRSTRTHRRFTAAWLNGSTDWAYEGGCHRACSEWQAQTFHSTAASDSIGPRARRAVIGTAWKASSENLS
jgi:phenylacetate-coenzyme A ligase PaaK-like adenylate-forming protein